MRGLVGGRVRWAGGVAIPTCLPPLLAALMRDDMLARFSASCFARCEFTCMSWAIVTVVVAQSCKVKRWKTSSRQY